MAGAVQRPPWDRLGSWRIRDLTAILPSSAVALGEGLRCFENGFRDARNGTGVAALDLFAVSHRQFVHHYLLVVVDYAVDRAAHKECHRVALWSRTMGSLAFISVAPRFKSFRLSELFVMLLLGTLSEAGCQ